jgi:hypothetical protein
MKSLHLHLIVLTGLLVANHCALAENDETNQDSDSNGLRHAVDALQLDVEQLETEASDAALQRSELSTGLMTLDGTVSGLEGSVFLLENDNLVIKQKLDAIDQILSKIETKKVFVTSQAYDGNLGGLAGADALCQNAADSAGLDGSFLAWLSTTTTSLIGETIPTGPAYRFVRHHVPYVLPNGQQVARYFGDLVDGDLENPIAVTEYGSTVFSGETWSATSANGLPAAGSPASLYTCENWTSGASSGGGLVIVNTTYFIGQIGATGPAWSSSAVGIQTSCAEQKRLICVEQ